jgi:tetratricopeptide (TPR) repeat protein
MIWGGFGVLAVIVIVVVLVASGGFGGKNPAGTASTASATPVMGVVSGDYATLVQKANGFYDLGMKQFQSNNMNQAVAYFQAAAMTYAAAWSKQHTDPNVGTDYATALFYSGKVSEATKQVQAVLKANPNFQQGWFNLGIYYTHQQALAKQNNQPAVAKKARVLAVAAFTKAIAINPSSQVGKSADQSLQQLPK